MDEPSDAPLREEVPVLRDRLGGSAGHLLDGAGIAAALGEGLERPIRYLPVPIEDFQALAASIPELSVFFAQHIGAVVAELIDGQLSETNNAVEELTGTPPMSVQDFARR